MVWNNRVENAIIPLQLNTCKSSLTPLDVPTDMAKESRSSINNPSYGVCLIAVHRKVYGGP